MSGMSSRFGTAGYTIPKYLIEVDGKTVIESTTERVRCSGENNDHPLVYYTIPEDGFVVCGYCDLVFVRKKNP